MKNSFELTKQLRADHAQLGVLADAFRHMLMQSEPPSGIALVAFRNNFSRQIIAHLRCEDMLLYPRLVKSDNAAVSTMARTVQNSTGGLLNAYKEWAMRWPTERARDQWPKFGADTQALLSALERRIDNENNRLYPLLDCYAHAHAG